jgi:hypothetical protein
LAKCTSAIGEDHRARHDNVGKLRS